MQAPQAPIVISSPPTVKSELMSHGLYPADIRGAALAALDYKGSLTKHNPPSSYPQIHGSAYRDLCDSLSPRGFEPYIRPTWYSTVVHPQRAFQIAVAVGTPETGVPDATPAPTNRWFKGRETRNAVMFNDPKVLKLPGLPSLELWVLLIYITPDKREVRSEFSKPLGFSDRHFAGWACRIIVEDEKPTSSDDHWSPQIDLDIRKRA